MGGDVAAGAPSGIAAQRVPAAQGEAAKPRRALLHAVEQVAIAHQEPHKSDQVAAVPLAVHVGFGGANAAIAGQRPVETGVVHLQADRRTVARLAHAHASGVVDQVDFSPAQGRELFQQATPQHAVQGSVGCGGRGANDAAHAGFSCLEGWSWTGVRLSQSRSACQWMPAITWVVIRG